MAKLIVKVHLVNVLKGDKQVEVEIDAKEAAELGADGLVGLLAWHGDTCAVAAAAELAVKAADALIARLDQPPGEPTSCPDCGRADRSKCGP